MVRVQLLKNTAITTKQSHKAKPLEILADKVHVPADETTYWCHVQKLPNQFQNKHHVVQVIDLIFKNEIVLL